MAEFTDEDKELLDKLRKAFEQTGKTRSQLDPWQEHLDRGTSVHSSRSVLAASIVEGFAGSWAAQYNYGDGGITRSSGNTTIRNLVEADPLAPPVPVRFKRSKLGLRGVPEIDFVPYNWRTNSRGSKGPALVGHPVSFEVVGPTLKSPFCDWTWAITPGGGPNGGDLLTVADRPDDTISPRADIVASMYGPRISATGALGWTIGDSEEPNGGLYLVVVDDGSNGGSLPSSLAPAPALDGFIDTAQYEIFRISAIDENRIEIHPNKPFSDFFDTTADSPGFRAIMLVRPYVARLSAIPQSGAAGGSDGTSVSGREQTFAVISPEIAASTDTYPPYGDPGGGAPVGTWNGGGFTEARAPGTSAATGDPDFYGGKVRLPIPKPLVEVRGTVSSGPLATTDPVGQWFVSTATATPFNTGAFTAEPPIVHIYSTTREDDLPDLTNGSVESTLGWFDVLEVEDGARTGILVARVNETDPVTGLTYFGPGPYIQTAIAPPPRLDVDMNLHRPVSSLFQGSFDVDGVEASRLKNLIDPRWVSRFEKQISDVTDRPPPGGAGAGRPDKAIFDTRTFVPAGGGILQAADPGSLLDLGFRMVLYPAKPDVNDPTLTVPDFDHPILGRELVIDGSLNEKQYVEVDYSAGLVRLSHPPPESGGLSPVFPSDVIPNGISGTANNPRGEVVLFGAFVPYSMEPAQTGVGPRVTTHMGIQGTDVDVASKRVVASIDTVNTTFNLSSPYIGPSTIAPNPVEIILDRIWEGPETGVITINTGNDDGISLGEWGYSSTRTVTVPGFGDVTALGTLSAIGSAIPPDPSLSDPEDPRSVVLRREVNFHDGSVPFLEANDTYSVDTTYGHNIRAKELRFEDAVSRYNRDGSVTIVPRSPGYIFNQQGAWMASGQQEPLTTQERISTTGILDGIFYQNESFTDTVSAGGTSQDNAGQYIRYSTSGMVANFTGVVSRSSRIRLSHGFRLVVKFRHVQDGADTFQGFVGLVGPTDDSNPPASALSAEGCFAVPSPGISLLGLRVNNAIGSANYEWITKDAATAGQLIRPTGVPIGQVQYLVIESIPFRDPVALGGDTAFVKMGLFDAAFQQVASNSFYNQENVPGNTDLEFTMGVRTDTGVGVRFFDLYSAVIVNHVELPFKALP